MPRKPLVAFELALKNQPGLRRVLMMQSSSVDEIRIGTINNMKLNEPR
jgi:hypothetical protein